MRFILLHGAYGNSRENWFPWLSEKLRNDGHEVVAPDFPTPGNQNFKNWKSVAEQSFLPLTEQDIVIGHSIGCAFALRLLEESSSAISNCILVSSFVSFLRNRNFDHINQTFVKHDFDWQSLKTKSKKITVFHGDDDPYVSLVLGREIADELSASFVVIGNGGHLNTAAGFVEFPQLLSAIED